MKEPSISHFYGESLKRSSNSDALPTLESINKKGGLFPCLRHLIEDQLGKFPVGVCHRTSPGFPSKWSISGSILAVEFWSTCRPNWLVKLLFFWLSRGCDWVHLRWDPFKFKHFHKDTQGCPHAERVIRLLMRDAVFWSRHLQIPDLSPGLICYS